MTGTIDLDYEDRKYMERSTIQEFVDASQLDVLLRLWATGEIADNNAFKENFTTLREGDDD